MNDSIRAELIAEIESFRAELRQRAEVHEHRLRAAESPDSLALDPSCLLLPEAKALIAKRYADARYEHRLQEVERRLAELEARNG